MLGRSLINLSVIKYIFFCFRRVCNLAMSFGLRSGFYVILVFGLHRDSNGWIYHVIFYDFSNYCTTGRNCVDVNVYMFREKEKNRELLGYKSTESCELLLDVAEIGYDTELPSNC